MECVGVAVVLSEHDHYGWQCTMIRKIKEVVKRKEDKGIMVNVDMGQGKTAPSLTAIWELLDLMLIDYILVVAPIKIIESVWRQEAKKWDHLRNVSFSLIRGNPSDRAFALAREAQVYLVNPEHLQWLHTYLRGDFSKFQLIFVDESSLFKNPRSKRFKTIKKIKDKHMDKITFVPMTGTPIPNSIMDIWTQAYMVDGGARLGDSFTQFRARFFKPGRKLAEHVYEWDAENDAFEQIKELVADITLELSDEQKKKFPVVPVDHWIELPQQLRDAYDRLEKEMIYEWEENVIIPKHGGSRSIILRQMAAGALYKNRLLGTDFDELHREKLSYLQELIEELNRPILLTYEFKHDLVRLKQSLPELVVLNEGKVSEVVKRFQNGEIQQLALHPANAAHGLDGLQHGGCTVVWFNEIWSQERHDQLIARLARNGQEAAQVFSHYIRAKDTVERLMQKAREEKGDEQTRFRSALRKYQRERGIA